MNNSNYAKGPPPGVGGYNDQKKKKRKDGQKQNVIQQKNRQSNMNANYSQSDQDNYGDQILNSLMSNDLFNQPFLGNFTDHHSIYPTQEIQFVNDIEQVVLNNQANQQIESEDNQKTKHFLNELNTYLQMKGDDLIEIGKKKIDWMESFIENKIKEKICCKVQDQIYDQEKLIFKESLSDQLLNKSFLKKQIITSLQEYFKQYFINVAKVYDLGLQHFIQYCQESEQISKTNNDKCLEIASDIKSLEEGEYNINVKLQEQIQQEQEEINNMKEMNEMITKYTQLIIQLKDKNSQLESYLQSLFLKINEKIRQNKKIVEVIVQNTFQELQQRQNQMLEQEKQRQLQQQQQLLQAQQKNKIDIQNDQEFQNKYQSSNQNQQSNKHSKPIDPFFQDDDQNDDEEEEEQEEQKNQDDNQSQQQQLKKGSKRNQKNYNQIDNDNNIVGSRNEKNTQRNRNELRQNYKNNFDVQNEYFDNINQNQDSSKN